MCGLAGLVEWGGDLRPSAARLSAALGASLAHRGPDGEGTYLSPRGEALLVHRRLAIIAPGPGGQQPMACPAGRHWIVWNGEVLNYRELGRQLERDGERLAGRSDTEVLLRWVLRHGPAGLSAVRGMFALALWDQEARSLLVARDRFGIKPLYVAAAPERVAFASELRALWQTGLVERRVAPAGVLAYLSWGSVPPPLTWLAGVESLPPGTWRRFPGDDAGTNGMFADIRSRYTAAADATVEEEPVLRARVRAAVEDSVRAHLVADVPVGVFLSGGIDSAALVSAARTVGASDLRTYTVTMPGSPLSEHVQARGVARCFETIHHDVEVHADSLLDDLPAILAHLDQPTGDAVNTFYVSRAVAATGIKAVLSGAGGDELFGGYPSFTRLPRALRLRRGLWPLVGSVAPVLGALLPSALVPRWRQFCAGGAGIDDLYRVQRGLFMPVEQPALVGPALREPSVWRDASGRLAAVEQALLPAPPHERPIASVARLETTMYLRSQLLRDLDVMSMAHGLEVRVPFVDDPLLSAVWPAVGAQPALLRGKRLLHETLARPLPAGITDRPKQGFTLPFAAWMEPSRGPLVPLVRDGLATLARDGWIEGGVPDAIWGAWRHGRMHWSRPWSLAVLGHFLGAVQ
ncbi:MAG: asparagine synthase (glutamine-hydrolyzing) [Acidobacteriota bacterium]|nr:asparagine synthase (glutamine-hydrolyzing) [Acidobacteriota bacterium]